VAHHPANPLGKSYQNGVEPPVNEHYETEFTDHGLQFAEQWSRALQVDPQLVMITQWNEWIAQRAIWEQGGGTYGGRPIKNGDSYFVDVFSKEFNRDIAPMKNGYTDNYYYQMLSYIRQYKGMEAPQEFSDPRSMRVDGDFTEWDEVTPLYEDPVGDVMHRDFRGYEAGTTYENRTGRNDILYSKVTYDADSLYFYVETREAMTPSSDTLWMLLLLDADRNTYTGWEGYDYLVKNNPDTPGISSLEIWNGNQWSTAGDIKYAMHGNQMEFALLRSSVGMDQSDPGFLFKWADNPIDLSDVTTFFMNGDAAPDRRFNFHFGRTLPEPLPQTPYKDHQLPGVIQFEDFDNGDLGEAYVDNDQANQGDAYRPESSVDIGSGSEESFYVGWTQDGEWLEYTVNVNAIGTFRVVLDFASENGGQKALLLVDDRLVTDTILFESTGALDKWAAKDNLLIQLSSGTKTLRFQILEANDDLNLDKMTISAEEVVYPGEGEGLFRSLWTAKAGGRGWFEDSICGEVDPFVEHVWEGSPGCGIEKSYWNARWEGQLESLFSETYTIYLTMDDYGKVWVDNQLLIDAWKSGSQGKTFSANFDLKAGNKVPIRVDFAQGVGTASIKLEWESDSNPRELIPQAQLFPEILTGVDENYLNGAAGMHIFPNPASDHITIYATGLESKAGVKICNLLGGIVYHSPLHQDETLEVSSEDWTSGLYFVELECVNGTLVKKLIIR